MGIRLPGQDDDGLCVWRRRRIAGPLRGVREERREGGPSAVGGKRAMPGGCLTCTEMLMSGVRTGRLRAASRVYRGGGWNGTAPVCRSAYGSGVQPEIYRYDDLGFRVASVPSARSQSGKCKPTHGSGAVGGPCPAEQGRAEQEATTA